MRNVQRAVQALPLCYRTAQYPSTGLGLATVGSRESYAKAPPPPTSTLT